MNEQELRHHGVKGMKWGVRKARPKATTDGSSLKAYQAAKKKRNEVKKVVQEKAIERDAALNYAMMRWDKLGWPGRKTLQYVDKTEEAYGQVKKQYKAAKAAEKAAKKMAKVEAREVKKMYRQQYMKGQSAVEKIWTRVASLDRSFANAAYKENKGAFDKNYKW